MGLKTSRSTIVDINSFYIGTNTYDVTTVPSNETKITASAPNVNDWFGSSVAVGLGRIVIGAHFHTVNGFTASGSAYIFDLNGNQLAKLTDSDPQSFGQFGNSVAVGSGRIVVGTPLDTVNGITNCGSAYIFDLNGNQLARITASDARPNDLFGNSVAVGCGRIVVGAYNAPANGYSEFGVVYIFDLDGNQLAKITASTGSYDNQFGWSVAVGCGRIVVGAPHRNIGTTEDAGAAFIFDLDGNELAMITSNYAHLDGNFGYSVAVGSGRIVVGCHGENHSNNVDAGAAYIFNLNGIRRRRIYASDSDELDRFGLSVAVGSGRIVVGSYGDDDKGSSSGSVYIFDLDGNELTKITASDGASSDFFGYSVAVGSGRIVVGAYGEDPNGISNAGAAYIYNTPYQMHYLDQLDKK